MGVSSYQLDTAERGFSYRVDAPLDMRMDRRQEKTARDIVNTYSEMELFRIIRDYGEDKFAKNIAKHIVMEREKGADRDYGAVMRDYPTCNSDEISEDVGASGKKNLSGNPD